MAEMNPTDQATVIQGARDVREHLEQQYRSRVPGSTFLGRVIDYVLNTNADVYAIRQDVAAIRRKLGA